MNRTTTGILGCIGAVLLVGGIILVILAIAVGASAFMGLITWLVYNAIAGLAGWPTISFWLAWGGWFLISAIFGLLRGRTVITANGNSQ